MSAVVLLLFFFKRTDDVYGGAEGREQVALIRRGWQGGNDRVERNTGLRPVCAGRRWFMRVWLTG